MRYVDGYILPAPKKKSEARSDKARMLLEPFPVEHKTLYDPNTDKGGW